MSFYQQKEEGRSPKELVVKVIDRRLMSKQRQTKSDLVTSLDAIHDIHGLSFKKQLLIGSLSHTRYYSHKYT